MASPPHSGLTSAEAQRRLVAEGYNEIAAVRPQLWLLFLRKLWAPVPWMLEAAVVLTLALGRYVDAIVIAFLLLFNAAISFLQEHRADTALQLLRGRLAVRTRALRDGRWQQIPTRELVRDDVVHLRMGDIVPADVNLFDGNLLLDQSPLTGESAPVERSRGELAAAGALVKHGEASGVVVATGASTSYGHTVELVKTARTVSHLETVVLTIVKYLVALDTVLALLTLGVALLRHLPLGIALPFTLMLLVASVPVALPATFTLAQALGAQELARQGVLITRLSAIEEAASMDLLCSDKTGTITENQLRVGRIIPYPPATEAEVVRLAALASDAASQDPIDVALLARAEEASASASSETPAHVLRFVPFDPATKRTEAVVEQAGVTQTVIKGAPHVVADLVASGAPATLHDDVAALASEGYRVLAIAAGPSERLSLLGLVGLADPPRPDSARLIAGLRRLHVRTLMLTGDTVETARAIAHAVGIGERVSDAATLRALQTQTSPENDLADSVDVVAGIFPEDKFRLVRALQRAGHVIGMTGDGINDAPALKQAEVGIAVASATDVAKAVASMVLTTPGLLNVLVAVDVSRRIYQRMRTYTLNKIVKTIQVALFLVGAFLLTQRFVITPELIVLLLFANDFVTMSLATDHVTPDPAPERWQVRRLFALSASLAALLVGEAALVLWLVTAGPLQQAPAQIPTVIFLLFVFSGQATVYVVRERRAFWRSLPSRPLLIASGADILVVSLLAIFGVLMVPISAGLVLLLLALTVVFTFALDALKLLLYRLLASTTGIHLFVSVLAPTSRS
jgi:H+-transporting ATPase